MGRDRKIIATRAVTNIVIFYCSVFNMFCTHRDAFERASRARCLTKMHEFMDASAEDTPEVFVVDFWCNSEGSVVIVARDWRIACEDLATTNRT
jgi:hypothetical protein